MGAVAYLAAFETSREAACSSVRSSGLESFENSIDIAGVADGVRSQSLNITVNTFQITVDGVNLATPTPLST